MIQDNEEHGGASEEDGERVELVVRYHFGDDRAFDMLAEGELANEQSVE
jgi:hypothetical protein